MDSSTPLRRAQRANMDRFSELKAFCLVAGSGGFSSAARQLGVATSSVTRLVDALEQRIGAPLLNRSTRSVTLTDSGSAYYARATAILEELEAADDAASARDGEVHGQLRVSAPPPAPGAGSAPERHRQQPGRRIDRRGDPHRHDGAATQPDRAPPDGT